MKEQLIYYSSMLDFILKTSTFPSYNSTGTKAGTTLSMDKTKLVSDLSYLLGKMDMCIVHNDQPNFDSICSIFKSTCEDGDIIFEEYEEWLNDQED